MEKPKPKTALQAAREYVEKQLQTMKEYGSAPSRLSRETYKEIVEEVAAAARVSAR